MSSTSSTTTRLSPSEIKFILDGISCGVRSDGRGLLETRHQSLIHGVLPTTHGSCQFHGSFYGTDIVCGIKLEVGNNTLIANKSDLFDVSVDLSATSRGDLFGQGEANRRVETRGRELADQVLTILQDTLPPLPIIEGKIYWIVYIDIVCFGDGGNLLDAIMLTIYNALKHTIIPKTFIIQQGPENNNSSNNLLVDFDVDPNPRNGIIMDVSSLCISTTIWTVNNKLLLDPTPEEEVCCESSIIVLTRASDGCMKRCIKRGSGELSPQILLTAISLGLSLGKQMLKASTVEYEDL
jgi:exosome complex RNA-binding protein Rrp42 (RNase PH superfamily)